MMDNVIELHKQTRKQTRKQNCNEIQTLVIHVSVRLVSIFKFVEELKILEIK